MKFTIMSWVCVFSFIFSAANVHADGLTALEPKEVDSVIALNLLMNNRSPEIVACVAELKKNWSYFTFTSVELFETLAPKTGEIINNLYLFTAREFTSDLVMNTVTLTIVETPLKAVYAYDPEFSYTCRFDRKPILEVITEQK